MHIIGQIQLICKNNICSHIFIFIYTYIASIHYLRIRDGKKKDGIKVTLAKDGGGRKNNLCKVTIDKVWQALNKFISQFCSMLGIYIYTKTQPWNLQPSTLLQIKIFPKCRLKRTTMAETGQLRFPENAGKVYVVTVIVIVTVAAEDQNFVLLKPQKGKLALLIANQ